MTAAATASHTYIRPQRVDGIVEPKLFAVSALDEGTAKSLPLILTHGATHWNYESSGVENLGGEDLTFEYDTDGLPGFTYVGPENATVEVSFDFQLAAAAILGPEAADSVTVAVMRDNEILGICNEGWMDEFDAGAKNVTGDVRVPGLMSGHALRLVMLSAEGNEDTLAFTVDNDYAGSVFVIS